MPIQPYGTNPSGMSPGSRPRPVGARPTTRPPRPPAAPRRPAGRGRAMRPPGGGYQGGGTNAPMPANPAAFQTQPPRTHGNIGFDVAPSMPGLPPGDEHAPPVPMPPGAPPHMPGLNEVPGQDSLPGSDPQAMNFGSQLGQMASNAAREPGQATQWLGDRFRQLGQGLMGG